MVDRSMRAVVQLGQRQMPELHQVAQAEHSGDLEHVVRVSDLELVRKLVAMRTPHRAGDL
jgi:hypothetical protein